MKIAVYSGSFNPMHKGHIAICRYLVEHAGYEKVYIIVSPHNPFKDSGMADNAIERLENVRRAIVKHGLEDKVIVDDIEFSMPKPSYSIDTLDTLKRREPENSFTLIIGGDNLPEMLRWKEGDRILKEYGIAVYPREGFDIEHDSAVLKQKDEAYRITLLMDASLVTVSSTEIRQRLSNGESAGELLA